MFAPGSPDLRPLDIALLNAPLPAAIATFLTVGFRYILVDSPTK